MYKTVVIILLLAKIEKKRIEGFDGVTVAAKRVDFHQMRVVCLQVMEAHVKV